MDSFVGHIRDYEPGLLHSSCSLVLTNVKKRWFPTVIVVESMGLLTERIYPSYTCRPKCSCPVWVAPLPFLPQNAHRILQDESP